MKIAVLNAEYYPVPPALGGPISRTIYETAQAYSPDEMIVISSWDPGLQDWDYDTTQFHHIRLEADESGDGWVPDAGLFQGTKHYLDAAIPVISKFSPDIIQIHNAPEYLPYLSSSVPDAKLLLFAHNPLQADYVELADIGRHADGIIFVSEAMQRRFHEEYPDATIRTEVVYNGVNTERFSPSQRKEPGTKRVRDLYGAGGPIVLFAGRILEQKGLAPLVDAVSMIKSDIQDVRLLIVGTPGYGTEHDPDDPFFLELREKSRSLGDAVRFVGYVDPERMPYFYAGADLTVTPSLWDEPFGKVVVESMASGTPVVASRRGGIPEIVEHSIDGVLVDTPEDPRALADAVISVLDNNEFSEALRRRGLETARTRFSNVARLAAVRSLYETVGKWPRRQATPAKANQLAGAAALQATLNA
jgi:spore coat protein SA